MSCLPLRCLRSEEPTAELDCWRITFFCAEQEVSCQAKMHVQAKASVDHVTDWLDAASTIKDLKLAPIAKRRWREFWLAPLVRLYPT